MKKFKIYGAVAIEDGKVITEKELRRKMGGWIENFWDGKVRSFNEEFGPDWKIVRVKRRFEIVEFGSFWNIFDVGDICKKKSLIVWFTEELSDWDGSIEELNKRSSNFGFDNSHIVFKEVYVEVKDK